MHLADRGRRGGLAVELREPLPPPQPELGVQDAFHLGGGHGRGLGLELGERLAEGLGVLVRHAGLEHAQGLPDLHGAALELSEDGEDLLGGLVGEFLRQIPLAPPEGAAAERSGSAAGDAQW